MVENVIYEFLINNTKIKQLYNTNLNAESL